MPFADISGIHLLILNELHDEYLAKSSKFFLILFLAPEKTPEFAGIGELARAVARQPIRNVSDEFPYKFKCRDLEEIIGKLGEYFLRVFSVNYAGIRASMP